MSPEHSKNLYSDGWRKHLRRERTVRNKLKSTTPQERQRKLTTASWTDIKGLLNLSTANNPMLHSIYEEVVSFDGPIRNIVRGWYDASYQDATTGDGIGSKNRNDFLKLRLGNLESESYDPLMLKKAEPLLKMIDKFMFKPIK